MSRSGSTVTDEQVKDAERVLYRHYRDWVAQVVTGLAQAIFDEEIDDAESLREHMEQDTDSFLIYTHDQRMVLFVSESTEAGFERAEDLRGGDEGHPDPALVALLTFQHDVEGRMEHVGMDLNNFDRDEWIKGGFGEDEEIAVMWDQHLTRGGPGLSDDDAPRRRRR